LNTLGVIKKKIKSQMIENLRKCVLITCYIILYRLMRAPLRNFVTPFSFLNCSLALLTCIDKKRRPAT
jgi:hypothetical protein